MSQRARRREGPPAKRRPASPRAVEIKGDPAFFRRINYGAVAAGFAVAVVIYIGLGALAYAPRGGVTNSSGAFFAISVLAMYAGGLTAGMIEPKYGMLNGPLVAVVFILGSVFSTFYFELQLVKVVGPNGLGPMRIDRVFEGDIPQLFFSTLGGLTAGWIERSVRAPRRAGKRAGGDGGG